VEVSGLTGPSPFSHRGPDIHGGNSEEVTVISRPVAALAAAAAVTAAGCGSTDKPAPKAPVASTTPAAPSTTPASTYNPKIVPADFTTNVTNKYFPMRPGKRWTYAGQKDGVPERVEVVVKKQTKTILGVPCVTVSDIVTTNNTLAEKTTDWYAQDKAGNLWYFGEDTAEYTNGVVTSTKGTWEAGVDNAKPGIVLYAKPKLGPFYRQEYRPGIAEDMARVIMADGTEVVPAGTFKHVVETRDINPLDTTKIENKWFAPGVGPIHVLRIRSSHREETRLVKTSG
jgi:hypothetical protein